MSNTEIAYISAKEIVNSLDFIRGVRDVREGRDPPTIESSTLYEDGRVFAVDWPDVGINVFEKKRSRYIRRQIETLLIKSVKSGSIL